MLITDIGTLAVVPPGPLFGEEMLGVEWVRDAALRVEDGRIAWFGPAASAPAADGDETLSARGGCVIPGLIDPHTHVPFVGDRSGEGVESAEVVVIVGDEDEGLRGDQLRRVGEATGETGVD